MTLAAADLSAAGATVERIPGPPGLGDCVRGDFPHPRRGEPGILIMSHLDTVHPVGTLAALPFRQEGGLCYGPGILDMKGGAYVALEAVATLARSAIETPLPVSYLFTCDEEIGSPGTRDLIMAEARRHRYVLVPEPGRPGNGVVTGRYAIARYNLEAEGRPSHAGSTLKDGRSAISAMARQLLAIEAMTDDDCTFSVGVIAGGQWVNCVATHCRGEALSMAKRQADLDRGVERMLALSRTNPDGTRFTVTRGVTRPVWEPNAGTMAMYETACDVARELGFELSHHSAGGGSDANFTGAAGIASLDGLGLLGRRLPHAGRAHRDRQPRTTLPADRGPARETELMARRPAFAADGSLVAPPGIAVPDLLKPDGATLRRRVAAREISSRELVSASLDQIDALNPTYNAVVSLRPRADILAEADRADAALAAGEPVGALHGLPIAIKDAAATAGLRTTYGSPLFADLVSTVDDLPVARIRAAGAIIVGKTNVPEFGLGSHTFNPVFGATLNAYDTGASAGGSSGGAAVALALHLLPIADGSDFGGSLRNPGAWNNVFGFRPSQGRVPSVPAGDPFYSQLTTSGPMGRSAADLATLLSVMAGPDWRAPLALSDPARRYEDDLAPTAHAPRILWLGDLGGHLATEPGVLTLCESALSELRAAGWAVDTEVPTYDWEALWRAFVVLRQLAMFTRYGHLVADPQSRAHLKPEMVWEIASGESLTAPALAAAMRTRATWYAKVATLLVGYDALALPTAQLFPFPVAWNWPKDIAGRTMGSYHHWMEGSAPGTLAGCPVANVPAGFDERGLPTGLQLIGVPRGDAALLALVARYERDAARAMI